MSPKGPVLPLSRGGLAKRRGGGDGAAQAGNKAPDRGAWGGGRGKVVRELEGGAGGGGGGGGGPAPVGRLAEQYLHLPGDERA